MNLLLDTHVFLWYVVGNSRLPTVSRDAIGDPDNAVFLSVASVWEAVVKSGLGKLSLPAPAEEFLPQQRQRHQIATLPIDEASLTFLAKLPLLHRDPFDRMLIAQAMQHDLAIVTVDDAIRAYPVKLLPVS